MLSIHVHEWICVSIGKVLEQYRLALNESNIKLIVLNIPWTFISLIKWCELRIDEQLYLFKQFIKFLWWKTIFCAHFKFTALGYET